MCYSVIASFNLFLVLFFCLSKRFWNRKDEQGRSNFPLHRIVAGSAIASVLFCAALVTPLVAFMPHKTVVYNLELSPPYPNEEVHPPFVVGAGKADKPVYYDVFVKGQNGDVKPNRIWTTRRVQIVEMPNLKGVGYMKRTMYRLDYSCWIGKWVPRIDQEYLGDIELDVPTGSVVFPTKSL